MILMIDNYDSFTSNLVQELAEVGEVKIEVLPAGAAWSSSSRVKSEVELVATPSLAAEAAGGAETSVWIAGSLPPKRSAEKFSGLLIGGQDFFPLAVTPPLLRRLPLCRQLNAVFFGQHPHRFRKRHSVMSHQKGKDVSAGPAAETCRIGSENRHKNEVFAA